MAADDGTIQIERHPTTHRPHRGAYSFAVRWLMCVGSISFVGTAGCAPNEARLENIHLGKMLMLTTSRAPAFVEF